MKLGGQSYTKEELEQIMEERKTETASTIAKRHGRTASSIAQTISNIKKARNGIIDSNSRSIARVLGLVPTQPMTEAAPRTNGHAEVKQQSSLDRLEDAFTHLQEEIANVVAEEVHKRTERAITEKTNELEEAKKAHHAESEKLRLIIKELQEASLSSVLKRKLMQ